MKKVTIVGAPSGNLENQTRWIVGRLHELAEATQQNDPVDLAQSFTITGAFTITRTLDVSTATLPDVIALIATFITDLQRGAINRTT